MLHFPGKERDDLVGLFQLACHLCQQLVAGDADVDREAERAENPVAQMLRRQHGRTVKSLGARHVDPRFVDRVLLDHRRDLAQEGDQLLRGGDIEIVIRLGYDEIGAFVARHAERLSGFDAVFFRGRAFCQHDARAKIFIVRNDRRNLAQVGRSSLDKRAVRGGPGQKRAVDIDVKPDRFCHQ